MKCTHPLTHDEIRKCTLKFGGCWSKPRNIYNKQRKSHSLTALGTGKQLQERLRLI